MHYFHVKQPFNRNKNGAINTNDTLKLKFMTPKIMHLNTNANGNQGWNILKCNILHDCLNLSRVCCVGKWSSSLEFSLCLNGTLTIKEFWFFFRFWKGRQRVMSGGKNRCVCERSSLLCVQVHSDVERSHGEEEKKKPQRERERRLTETVQIDNYHKKHEQLPLPVRETPDGVNNARHIYAS